MVLLHSFFKTNPWFEGDFFIIHQSLSDNDKEKLVKINKNCRFKTLSKPLLERIEQLGQEVPRLRNRLSRFFSIEAFAFENYKKVLFCDSDMLFRDCIQEVFSIKAGIAACADGSNNRGNARDSRTYEEVERTSACSIQNTFNAGFMLLDESITNRKTYNRIHELLDRNFFENIKSDHTDQVLYNIAFDGQQKMLDGCYNYLLAFKRSNNYADRTGFDDAKVLHFNGPIKPWMVDRTPTATGEFKAGLKLWLQTYRDAISRIEGAT